MANSFNKKLVSLPIILIGVGLMVMGLAWIFYPQPWLLDKSANEILLQTSYDELFGANQNNNLIGYLRGVYGFFGLWTFSVGVLIIVYVKSSGFNTPRLRNHLYLALLTILSASYVLIFTYVPTSPFLYVTHSSVVMVIISFFASRRA